MITLTLNCSTGSPSDLRPPISESYSTYRVWLKAFTWKNEGSPSQQLSLVTDVTGPASPVISNLTCADDTSLHIEWVAPEQRQGLQHYTLLYSSLDKIKTVTVEVKNSSGNSHKVRDALPKKIFINWNFSSGYYLNIFLQNSEIFVILIFYTRFQVIRRF